MKNLIIATAATVALMASVTTAQADGQKTYQTACFACHGTGAAGAPKIGDKAAWAPRIAQGMATLEKHALHGFKGKKGVMPAKGGRADLSDDDVKAAVAHMVSQSK
ncbi:Cytochrome c5 [hydrothermal vent metagenome]|uniref:Cytochrome c5 n=1 Tax=hydrothermal vent metagenome TaxID=652676 RepID=A0A3B1BI56_9ZZZZ